MSFLREKGNSNPQKSIENEKFIQFTCRQRLCVMNIKKINCFIYPKVCHRLSHSSPNILRVIKKKKENEWRCLHGMSFDTRRSANKRRGWKEKKERKINIHLLSTKIGVNFDSEDPQQIHQIGI